MLTDEQKADGWIEHDGGPCPVGLNTRIAEVMFRDGIIRSKGYRASSIGWRNDLIGSQHTSLHIIAYRPEPRP